MRSALRPEADMLDASFFGRNLPKQFLQIHLAMSENDYFLALANRENGFVDESGIWSRKERLETTRDVSAFKEARMLRAIAAIIK